MIFRLAGGHRSLLLLTIVILIAFAGIMTEQIKFLAENHHMNFIPAEIGLEQDITILTAAFGVFLEHRRWLLDRMYPDGMRWSHIVGQSGSQVKVYSAH
jgi:hypothetical protein